MNGQSQKSGAGSIQAQAAGDLNIITKGVSLKDVQTIAKREAELAVSHLTMGALEKANERIAKLTESLITAFAPRPELLSAFADPDFQFSLQDAYQSAASSAEPHTEELLIDLLSQRAEQGDSNRIRLVIGQAIKSADKLSAEALNGLTAVWVITSLSPSRQVDFESDLSWLNTTNKKVLQDYPLPSRKEWVSDLEILNMLQTTSGIFNRRPYEEVQRDRFQRYLVNGIENSALTSIKPQLDSQAPSLQELIKPHPLKVGFHYLQIDSEVKWKEFLEHSHIDLSLLPEVETVLGNYNFASLDSIALQAFNDRLKNEESITIISAWWNALPPFNVTRVGDVVGFANAKRKVHFTGADTISDLLALRDI